MGLIPESYTPQCPLLRVQAHVSEACVLADTTTGTDEDGAIVYIRSQARTGNVNHCGRECMEQRAGRRRPVPAHRRVCPGMARESHRIRGVDDRRCGASDVRQLVPRC